MVGAPLARGRLAALFAVGLVALAAVLLVGPLWAWEQIASSGRGAGGEVVPGPPAAQPDPTLPSPPDLAPGTPAPQVTPASCPAEAAVPDPDRPSVSLRFDVSDDRRVVSGSETVTFVPDIATTELVFRLWPNAAISSQAGASLEVTSVSVDGRSRSFGYEGIGAGRDVPGTLLVVPLGAEVEPGQTVTADLAFTLRLPPAGKDRYGAGDSSAWWGSGHPMLAWIDGVGWHRDPPPRFPGEGAGSEAADTRILVVAPAGDTVLTSGTVREVEPPADARSGTQAWAASNPVARDVSVAVGDIALAETEVDAAIAPGVGEGDGVPLTVGVAREAYPTAAGVRAALESVVESGRDSLERFTFHLGFYPYPSLNLVVLPGIGAAGIEYPGSILLGTAAWTQVIPHEVAHQWFYGMVGNNQSVDPWLDEAFATYLESMYNATGTLTLSVDTISDPVGWPVSAFQGLVDYSLAVYSRGGGALLLARAAVGGQAFDDATRCYVRAQAWQVAEPDDVATAYGHLPEVIEVLRRVEALDAPSAAPAGYRPEYR